jgi:hypothetical protein
VLGLLAALVFAAGCNNPPKEQLPIQNGGFDTNLNGWTTDGDVEVVDGAAKLADSNDDYSLLFQTVSVNTGRYILDFEFANHMSPFLSDPGSGFGFQDICFASLYFLDDLNGFDLNLAGSQNFISLFNLDFEAPYDVTGTITKSARSVGWWHFTLPFQNNWKYAVPVFEILDLNGIANDSSILMDDVVITPAL